MAKESAGEPQQKSYGAEADRTDSGLSHSNCGSERIDRDWIDIVAGLILYTPHSLLSFGARSGGDGANRKN